MRWYKYSILCLGVIAPLNSTACSVENSEHEGRYGSANMQLRVAHQGYVYELVNATFDIQGPSAQLVDAPPAQAVLQVSLQPGNYSVELQPGWQLQRTGPTGVVEAMADAVLLSANPENVEIFENQTSSVNFRFSADGAVIEFGDGTLALGIEVCDESGCSGTGGAGTGGAGTGGSASGGSASGGSGTGGSGGIVGQPSFFSNNGYGQGPAWRGYLWALGSPSEVITPDCSASGSECFLTSGPYVCVGGTLDTSYESFAMVGWNLNQTLDPSQPPGTWPLQGFGVDVRLDNHMPSGELRVQLTAQNGQSWCAAIPPTGGPVSWNQFSTECWNGIVNPPPMGIPISSLAVIVPGAEAFARPYEFCVVDMRWMP